MQPQWDDIRVFLAVARDESLSGAGKKLKMDPATVGRRIARLEASYGAPLFGKSPTGYALTDLGERLVEHAVQIEQSMEAAAEEVSGGKGTLKGHIRIGAPDGSANFLLPQVCAEISRANPELEIHIVALPRVINLSKREADFVIAVSPPVAGRLMVQKICDYQLSLAAAESYLEGKPEIRSIEDVKAHKIVGYIPDMIFDKELDYLGQVGIEKPDFGSNSVSVQINWVRQGAGIGFVHDFSLPMNPSVRRILTDQVRLTRSFYLVRHQDDSRLERMNRFAAALSEGMRKEVARLETLVSP
ncbi:LysR family transcriptional regulator [Cognatishimia activa]|uniref:HTH-type transcriptional regulator GltR n=1 Tax=Cognatishimia activa TaxID=1715691 RepID=A0A0P1JBX3_9RHOB|nr:LysR family transcriptional regulator [Cognatishimia activa]MEE2945482.1 LysR family transcriptional regulator [Pseudomonadota bacterium]CUJ36246.1 HTH-type transcriptional regulator GltR [Cognatishimia activa]CUK27007.1 HTH-type transcriptional regulator GltR [Cognatishimia activa]